MDVSYIFIRPIADAIKRHKRTRPRQPTYTINPENMWNKAMLWVFWILSILLCVVGWGLAGLGLALKEFTEGDVSRSETVALTADAAIWLSWATVSFILVITEMIMYIGRNNLRPLFAVISNSIKSILWLVLLIIAIRNVAAGTSAIQAVVLAVFFIVFVIPLIYSVVVYRRERKRVYTPVDVESAPARENQLQPDIEISSYDSYRQPGTVHNLSSVPQIPSQVARPNAYEPLRPGYGAPVSPPLEDQSPFHDRNLASELSAAEKDYANEPVQPRRASFDPYRAPAPVELVGSPPPASSIYSQPEPEKRF